MIKKTRQPAVAEKDSFLAPSSSLLDNHFDEILETTEEILGLVAILARRRTGTFSIVLAKPMAIGD